MMRTRSRNVRQSPRRCRASVNKAAENGMSVVVLIREFVRWDGEQPVQAARLKHDHEGLETSSQMHFDTPARLRPDHNGVRGLDERYGTGVAHLHSVTESELDHGSRTGPGRGEQSPGRCLRWSAAHRNEQMKQVQAWVSW